MLTTDRKDRQLQFVRNQWDFHKRMQKTLTVDKTMKKEDEKKMHIMACLAAKNDNINMTLKQQLKTLLLEVSQVLDANKPGQQALKHRINAFLADLDNRLKGLECSQRSSCSNSQFIDQAQLTQSLAEFNAKLDNGSTSDEETTLDKSAISEVQLKLDCYIMEIENNKRSYDIIKIKQTGPSRCINQIGDLLLADLQNHIRKIQIFYQISEKTGISPLILKPIVFQLNEGQRYVYVFETKQYLRRLSFYEQSDRFFIFITEEYLPLTITQMARKLIKMEYVDRFWLGGNKYELDYSDAAFQNRKKLVRDMANVILQTQLFYFRKDGNFKQQKKAQLKWYLRSVSCYSLLTKISYFQVISISILSVVLYYVLRDYKIIMIGSKTSRHVMSEIVMALKTALLPMKYSYPTIFACISDFHNNYIDTPIPSMLMLWGSRQQCEQIINQHSQDIKKNTKFDIPTIVIDLHSKILISQPLTSDEARELKHLEFMLKKTQITSSMSPKSKIKASNESIVDKAHKFVFQQLLSGQIAECKQLQKTFKETYLFKNYCQTK